MLGLVSNNLELTKEQAEQLIVSPKSRIAIDIETISLEDTLPLGIAIAVSSDTSFYFFNVRDELIQQAVSSSGLVLFHNAAYDIPILEKLGIKVSHYEDTMLLAYSAGILDKSLESLSFSILNAPYTAVTSQWKKANQGNIAINHIKMAGWSIQHSLNTYNLWDKLPKTRLYRDIDRPCIDLVLEMEKYGILIDQYRLTLVEQQAMDRATPLEQELKDELHVENLNSNPQVAEALRSMGIIGTRKTKSDRMSVSEESLKPLNLPVTNKLLEYRGIMKTLSTYIPALRKVDSSGRVHTHFGYTDTGRWSSSRPNLQNLTRNETMEITND